MYINFEKKNPQGSIKYIMVDCWLRLHLVDICGSTFPFDHGGEAFHPGWFDPNMRRCGKWSPTPDVSLLQRCPNDQPLVVISSSCCKVVLIMLGGTIPAETCEHHLRYQTLHKWIHRSPQADIASQLSLANLTWNLLKRPGKEGHRTKSAKPMHTSYFHIRGNS